MSQEPSLRLGIRPASVWDAPGIAETHVAGWKTTYRGIVPQTYLDSLNLDDFTERWRTRLASPSDMVIYVAERAGTVCGFASGGPARHDIAGFSGELYAIYLSPPECSKGIGSRLFWTIAKELKDSGHNSMYVWVLEKNPSRGFYEGMGGSPLTSAEIEIGGETLTEVSYGWRDLQGCLSSESQASRR